VRDKARFLKQAIEESQVIECNQELTLLRVQFQSYPQMSDRGLSRLTYPKESE